MILATGLIICFIYISYLKQNDISKLRERPAKQREMDNMFMELDKMLNDYELPKDKVIEWLD